jgi:hypothetical protein
MFKIEKPGIYVDVPTNDYFQDCCIVPSLTQSISKILIDRSPLHAWHAHPRLNKNIDWTEDYDSAKAIGNAAHKLFLGRGKEVVVLDAPDFRTKAAKEERDAAMASGGVPILGKHMGRAQAMVKVAKEVLAAHGLAEFSGDSEAVIAWQEGDIWFRSMIDRLSTSRTIVLDFKTSGMVCAPHAIPRMMVNAGWDIQASMHERGLDVLHPEGMGRRRHIFVAQENTVPYAVTVVELTEAVMTMGRKRLQMAVDIWKRCIATNRWPSYPMEILRPEYPSWEEKAWLDREIEASERDDKLLMAG